METIESIINDLPTCVLLSIGRRVCPSFKMIIKR
jgi:hypothetical protein